jgi:3-oxoacyl-[acyl-carrier protein] reductase
MPAPSDVVLVTGGSRGIGRAICEAFGQSGYDVAVHYRERKSDAESTLASVCASGGRGEFFQADIRNAVQVQQLVDAVVRRFGRLDVLICNAGIAVSQLVVRQSGEQWADVIDTNLTGTFHCVQAAGRQMLNQGTGSILVVGSYAAFHGASGQAAYAASKAGLVGLVRTAAREWGPSNVRVNLLCPGWQQTELAGDAVPSGDGLQDHYLGRTPSLGEVAKTAFYLARCFDVSGQVWNCDSRIL